MQILQLKLHVTNMSRSCDRIHYQHQSSVTELVN